jgi:tRNA1Val (adenine37-N6)-methyltransferase
MVDDGEARRLALEHRRGEPITLDALTGRWSILQRKRGHRHSTDDVLTAWYALQHGPPVDATLDLGTGIGTVGLLTLHGLGEGAELHCVEAQEVSYELLLENIALNGLEERVHPVRGDLREVTFERTFDLITGSPPYFDVAAGVLPPDSQKAHARFELRGTVADYAAAAARWLSDADHARFVFCFPTPQKDRAFRAIHDHGFSAVAHRDVIPRASRDPLFSLFACRRGEHPENEEPPFVVRDADGEPTPAIRQVRRGFAFDVD